jgi:hypothetical protein
MKCLLLGLSLYLSCISSQAAELETVFYCKTASHKEVSLVRDVEADRFTLTYGQDLTNPEIKVSKLGSELGTLTRHSSGSDLVNTEIYMDTLAGYITVGLTDFGAKGLDGYFSVDKGKVDKPDLVTESCIDTTLIEKLNAPNTTIFKNITEVDDY